MTGDVGPQRPIRRRVHLIQPAADHADDRPAPFEGGTLGDAVDAGREARHHRDARRGQPRPQHLGHRAPVRGTPTRAHDAHAPDRQVDVGALTEQQHGRLRVRRPQFGGFAARRHAQPHASAGMGVEQPAADGLRVQRCPAERLRRSAPPHSNELLVDAAARPQRRQHRRPAVAQLLDRLRRRTSVEHHPQPRRTHVGQRAQLDQRAQFRRVVGRCLIREVVGPAQTQFRPTVTHGLHRTALTLPRRARAACRRWRAV